MSFKKILIVDDSEFERALLTRALSERGAFTTLERGKWSTMFGN